MAYRIAGDVHTHTMFSRHAYSTIAENVAAAKAAGVEVLGSTDHFSCMLFPEQHLRNFQFFTNTGIWPRVWGGVTLLRGAEVDIAGLDGELFGQDVPVSRNIVGQAFSQPSTLFARVTEGLDYLIASVHNSEFTEGASLARTTDMYVRALENPKVLILGHTGRSGVAFDIDEVLARAKELGKLIEINEHSLEGGSGDRYRGICTRIAERCAELGVGIAVSSDAHIASSIGRYPNVTSLLEGIGFPEELIANRAAAPFIEAMRVSGVCDPSRFGL